MLPLRVSYRVVERLSANFVGCIGTPCMHSLVGAAKTLIHRFRKQYSAILREEIGRTVADPADIEQEIHALCDALVAAEGRI